MSEIDSHAIVREQLKDLRKRLLDFTTRNRLLSTKFGKRSRREVRIIDELPDELFKMLTGGKPMTFQALPDFDKPLPEEKKAEFKSELRRLKLSDEDHREKIRQLDQRQAGEPAYVELEDELRNKVRENLGLPPRPKRAAHDVPSLRDWAKLNGLNPEFDLPVLSGGPPIEAHTDDKIQLLLLPDQADPSLQAIYLQARSHMQETGLSVLFMAFGFLEWREPQEQRSHFAPLLLLPVGLERKAAPGRYVFKITGDDSDPVINVTLQEFLRQKGIGLPELEEEDSPENYWKKIEESVIAENPSWSLRRFVAFGLFPFASMAMYADLHPDGSIGDSELVQAMLVGQRDAGSGMLVDEYDIDDPEVEKKAPVLITDADSSQHSAIIDVMAGRNIVIEGPPGTGKSQTITNLIGAALYEGKNVLFVAEKMAALNIVYNRLKSCGLGDFVLELHARHSSKRNVVASLGRAIDSRKVRRSRGFERELDERREELQRRREQLNDYVGAMNQPLGKTGKTVHDILWAARNQQEKLNLPLGLREQEIFSADQLTVLRISERRELLDSYARTYRTVLGDVEEKEHPWFGVTASRPDAFTLETIEGHAGSLLPKLSEIINGLDKFHNQHGIFASDWSTESFGASVDALGQFVSVLPRLGGIQIQRLVQGNVDQPKMANWMSAARTFAEKDGALRLMLPTKIPAPDEVRNMGARAEELAVTNLKVGQLNGRIEDLNEALRIFINVRTVRDVLSAKAGVSIEVAPPDLNNLIAFQSAVEGEGAAALGDLTEALASNKGAETIQELETKANKLLGRLSETSKEFDLSAVGSLSDLERRRRALETAGPFSFLNGKVREASRFYRARDKNHEKTNKHQIAARFLQVEILLDEIGQFNNNKQGKSLSDLFKGLETDFERLRKSHIVFRNLKASLDDTSGNAAPLEQFVIEGTKGDIVSLAEAVDRSVLEEAKSLFAAEFEISRRNRGLDDRIHELENQVESFVDLNRRVKALGMADTVEFSEFEELARMIETRATLRGELESKAAGLEMTLPDTVDDLNQIVDDLQRVDILFAQMPPNLMERIGAAPDAADMVLDELRALNASLTEMGALATKVEDTLEINQDLFYGGKRQQIGLRKMLDRLRAA